MSARRFCNEESLASSDSDEFHEVFYSSSSHDRSSVGSIPWAEDAIKQNQQEWERLERMFYGEEDLPDEQELRNEIIEWTTAFPHLRIVGKRLTTPGQSTTTTPDTEAESIKNDLPDEQRFNKDFSFIHPEAKSIFYELGLANLLERDLRISSVPMLSKRRQISDLYANKEVTDTNPKKVIQIARSNAQQQGSSGKIARRQFLASNSSNSLLLGSTNSPPRLSMNPSSSAKIVRMPPIVNFIMPQRKYLPPATAKHYFVSSATTKKHQQQESAKSNHRIMLPVLNLDRADLSRELTSRSISAALNERQFLASYLPNSASKLKISK